MPFPFLAAAIGASAVLGAGASIYAGNQQSAAAREAARQSSDAARRATLDQAQARDTATAVLSPYSQEGQAARTSYNAFLGIPTSRTNGATAAAASNPYTEYVNSNPDLKQEWARLQTGKSATVFTTPEQYGRWHYETYGKNEGRQLPNAAQPEATTQQASNLDADRAAAYDNFEKSPYSVAAQTGAEKAQQAIMGSAGASGGVLRGRTVNTIQANQTQYKQNALLDYMNQLNGVAARGFDADSGIASAGQTFANNSGAAALNGAAASGNALLQGAQARAGGIQGAALIANNALSQFAKPLGSYYGSQPPLTGATTNAIELVPQVPQFQWGGG